MAEAMFGIIRGGFVAVPLNVAITDAAVAGMIANSAARAVFASDEHVERVERLRPQLRGQLDGRFVAVDAAVDGWRDYAGFVGAAPAFAILAWILPIHLLSGHARFALIAAGHQRAEMAAQAVGLAVTIVLGMWWVGPWGGPGAAAAMVASAAVVWAVAHVQARRRVAVLSPFAAGERP